MIFIDTTEWVSAIDSSDQLHADGAAVLTAVARNQLGEALTTDFVLDETFTLLKRRGVRPHKVVEAARHILASEVVKMVYIDGPVFQGALRNFSRFERLSFTDAATLEVMKRFNVTEIYSHDSDFDLKGIVRKERP